MRDFYKFYNWYLRYFRSKDEYTATIYDKYMALSYAVRTNIVEDWIDTQRRYRQENARRIYYVSLDYSFGRSLKRFIIDAGMERNVKKITKDLNTSLDTISACEPEFELGNSGKGGMTHCIQETLASQGIPAMGYGLWYDYAQFRQVISQGMQIEHPYNWKRGSHPWSVNRPEYEFEVSFGGKTEKNEDGSITWIPDERVRATPWDYPVVGYRNGVVNTARFWEALSVGGFHPDYANHGDYPRACDEKADSTNVTRYLFPDGAVKQTTTVRIKQQYFLAAASVQDIMRRYKATNSNIEKISDKVIIHLADSKCTIMILEMLRTLQYDEGLSYDVAFTLVRKMFVFSTTALNYEDFETWPVYLVEEVLPLHVKMVFEMNQRMLENARKEHGFHDGMLRDLSLIEEGAVKKIRLAHVAAYVSNFVTGVSDSQTLRLKDNLFNHFEEIFGTSFVAGSSGLSIRRWLTVPNQPLSELISQYIGENWVSDNRELVKFLSYIHDKKVHAKIRTIRDEAKASISERLHEVLPHPISSNSLLISHVRKVHPSRRQTLQIIFIIHRYLELKKGKRFIPRTYLFGGYAAPTDFLGKQLIHLINVVAQRLNSDVTTNEFLQLAFIPNCTSTYEEELAPAIDLVEHPTAINGSSVGMDILKYVVNGALPLVGENHPDQEIAALLGGVSVFSFKDSEDVDYLADDIVNSHEELQAVFSFIEDLIKNTPGGEGIYPLLSSLRYNDEYRVLGAFDSYCETQSEVDTLFKNKAKWVEWALHNIARSGVGSLDGIVSNFYTKTGTK